MKKILFLALLLTLSLCVLVGCGSKAPAETQPNETVPNVTETQPPVTEAPVVEAPFEFDGSLAKYTIIYGEDSKESRAAAQKLWKGLTDIGVNIPNQGDIEIPEIEYQLRTDFEIVVGKTSRDADLGALAEQYLPVKDYIITYADSRIFILGGSEEALNSAVDYFLSNLMNGTVCTFKETVKYAYDYPEFTVGGVAIDAICSNESTEVIVRSIRTALENMTGKSISVTEEMKDSGVVYFDIDFDKYGDSYHIKADGGNLCICAPTEFGLKSAAIELIAMIEESKEGITLAENADISDVFVKNVETLTDYKDKLEIIGTTEKDALSYKLDEEIPFSLTLRYNSKDTVGCTQFKYTVTADGAQAYSGTASGAVGEFKLTVPAGYIKEAGSVRLAVNALDSKGATLATYIGGAIVNMDEISSVTPIPDDFVEFWTDRLNELYAVDPTDTTAPSGDKHFSNYFHYYKIDEEYIKNSINCAGMEKYVNDFDMYEVFLAAPGEMPAVFYISIPKNFEENTLHISGTLNHYSARDGYIGANAKSLVIGIGPCGMPGVYYDEKTGAYTAAPYETQKGFALNSSDYDDPTTAYFVRMLQRNIQVYRFISNPEFTKGTPFEAATKAYNGKMSFTGGSMGGFQSVATAALVALTADLGVDVGEVTKIDIRCPWMCDPIAMSGGSSRIAGIGTKVGGAHENLKYFDTAHFGTMVECEVALVGGFADTTCPSTGIVALYNALNCKTTFRMVQNKDHSGADPRTVIEYKLTK